MYAIVYLGRWRIISLLLSVLVVSTLPLGALMQVEDSGNALGRADRYGYVRICYELGRVPLSGGNSFALNLVFSSNPVHEPGVLGPGWRMPLVESSVVRYNKYNLVWEAPDEERYFFVPDDRIPVRRGEEAYRDSAQRWNALVSRRGDILITGRENPTWAFDYRNGRLQRFRLGPESDIFRIEYNSRGHAVRIVPESTRIPVFEIDYHGATPRLLRAAGRELPLELGPGEMMSPDGRTEYAHHRFPFLKVLGQDRERLAFHYLRTGFREREAYVRGTRDRTQKKGMTRVPVNRLVVQPADAEQYQVQWEATSGFIISDTSGSYEIENVAYDPHLKNDDDESKRVRISPNQVAIKYNVEGEGEWLWSYNWNTGVLLSNNPKTEKQFRRTYIMALGPAHMKLRRTEINEGEGWRLVDQRAYDAMGRIIRRIRENETTVWKRNDGDGSLWQYRYQDGNLAVSSLYEGSKLRERVIHGENEERYQFSYTDGMRHVSHLLNGEHTWDKKYDSGNRLMEMSWPHGRTDIYEYTEKGTRLYRMMPDGKLNTYFRAVGSGRLALLEDF